MERVPPVLLPDLEYDVPPGGLSIGEASRLTGVGIEALRYYEREGLVLDPAARDAGGRRRYGADDLRWIAGLVMLRETGMSIADIRAMADLSRIAGTEAERLVLLEGHRHRVLDELARTQGHLLAIERKIAAYREVVGTEGQPHEDHPSG
ncbi:MerR family transcriptional regulator [Nocardioides lianchengensis]|uniref:DNA-binding transcriptional regulator, MerR family n=1 Tax=Nocardioides lianchengensis TaxID=1045774 RepID=A0A1G6PNZ6_9ACTN|nr:MerR family transcriptional regulator [Nocardioides lianchengensis]NYG11920.1 DNA-binding transcriptional MerR regulator [Nocardioides lianchengensis]SDC81701.1 DNA-binding transcriptional regulator, MerR family [Nocardioides lianchengensis]